MSNEHTPALKRRLSLPDGAEITLPDGTKITVEEQAFLLMGDDANVEVPEGTDLDIPVKGKVKASTGTTTKATSGTRTDGLVGVDLEVITASTLNQPLDDEAEDLPLPPHTKIKSPPNGEPVIIMAEIAFGVAENNAPAPPAPAPPAPAPAAPAAPAAPDADAFGENTGGTTDQGGTK
jgi:hypothetical protein